MPSASSAQSNIPSDKTPASLAGFKFTRTITFLPTICLLYTSNAHGLLKVFGSWYKKIWIEYSGIVNLGIDINKVDISEPDTNNVITIKIPDAEVQSTSLDKSTLSEPLTDKGVFTKITTEEKTEALSSAQQNMKETAQKDTSLLAQAKEHAKLILQGYINNLGEEFNEEYTIKWVDVSE